MLIGNLHQEETYQSLLIQPIWNMAFTWLKEHSTSLPPDGEYSLQGNDMRAIVQTVTTRPRDNRQFEAHQREIDLHYCIDGSELIEWTSVTDLIAKTAYNSERDFTLYTAPPQAGAIHMTPGTFATFLPADAHLPGITAEHEQIKKVVIKINAALLAP